MISHIHDVNIWILIVGAWSLAAAVAILMRLIAHKRFDFLIPIALAALVSFVLIGARVMDNRENRAKAQEQAKAKEAAMLEIIKEINIKTAELEMLIREKPE